MVRAHEVCIPPRFAQGKVFVHAAPGPGVSAHQHLFELVGQSSGDVQPVQLMSCDVMLANTFSDSAGLPQQGLPQQGLPQEG